MKKFKLIEEVGWMLTDEAKTDKNLNAVDKNMLAILQFIEDGKATHGEWFRILIKHPKGKWDDDEYNSIEKLFDEFEVPVVYRTLNRSVNKLQRLGYIDYKTGWYNNTTGQGMTPMIKLVKGTIPIKCSDIVTAKDNTEVTVNNENTVNSEKLTTDKSDAYSDNVTAYEKEKKKEKENKGTIEHKSNTYNISTSKEAKFDVLFNLLVDCDDDGDDIPVLTYLSDHFIPANVEYIRKWWKNKPDKLQVLDNYCNHLDNLDLDA